MLSSLFILAVVIAHSASGGVFTTAQLWSIIGVGIAALGLIGGWFSKARLTRQHKDSDSINLYIHFVDDLQVELKRLHDLLLEERRDCAAEGRAYQLTIEKLEMKILALQRQIEEAG